MGPYDAVFVGSGINALAGGALLSKAGWRVCILERNDRLGGAIRTEEGLVAPGFTHEVFSSWHPLFTGLGGVRGARRRPRAARPRVPQHRPADGQRVPGRVERVPDDLARGQRRRARRPRGRGRRRLARRVRRVHGERRPLVRRALVGALVGRGPRPRRRRPTAASAAAGCSPTAARCSRAAATGSTATFASPQAHGLLAPVGAAHRPRAGAADLRLHDEGDRRRAAARRHARAEGRRRQARRRAGGDRPRGGRRPAHRRGGRADPRLGRPRDRRAPGRTARRSSASAR